SDDPSNVSKAMADCSKSAASLTPAPPRPVIAALATAVHLTTLRPSVREAGTASWIAFGRVLAWRWTLRAELFHCRSARAMEDTKRPVLAIKAILNVDTVATSSPPNKEGGH